MPTNRLDLAAVRLCALGAIVLAGLTCFAEEPGAGIKLLPREKKFIVLKEELKTFGGKGEGDRVFLDCAPDSPHILVLEKSASYNADLMLDAFKKVMTTLYKLFIEQFGPLLDAKSLGEGEICPVYIFETRERYMKVTAAPYFAGGHFDPANGMIYLYKDTPNLYETMFHEGIHQLLQTVSQKNVAELKDRSNKNMLWFTEGLACWFENFKHNAKGEFVLGEVSSQYLPFTRKLLANPKHVALEAFMSITYTDFLRKSADPVFVQTMYAQSWSVVYFLRKYSDGKYKDKFDQYFKTEAAGEGSLDVAKTIFGDLGALNREYEEFYGAMK